MVCIIGLYITYALGQAKITYLNMLTFRYTNLLPLHMTRPTTTWHLQESTRAGPASCNTQCSRVMNEHP
jgi:hypothetical protein